MQPALSSRTLLQALRAALPEDRLSAETAAFAVDGILPAAVAAPSTREEAASVLAVASAQSAAVVPWGGGTGLSLGLPPQRYDLALDLRGLNRLVEYEPADLTVTVEAGMRLSRLQRLLGERGQWLPLDPPLPEEATIGGVLATNAGGPARIAFGTARDRLIGITVATPGGELVKAGGRVVKNVAGYDLGKLHIGALGTLGVIVQAGFKVAPLPKAQRVLAVRGAIEGLASSAEQALSKGLAVTGLVLTRMDGDWRLAVRLAGGLAAAERSLRDFPIVGVERLTDADADRLWQELTAPDESEVIVKATVPAAETPSLGEDFARHGARVRAYLGAGVVYGGWTAEPSVDALQSLRDAAESRAGALVLERAGPSLKRAFDVWGRPRGDFALMQRLKDQFDPARVLNPGRFLGGI